MKTPAFAIISCIALTSALSAEAEEPKIIRPIGILDGDAKNLRIQARPARVAGDSQTKLLKDVELTDATIQSLLQNKEAKTTLEKLKAAVSIQSLDDALKHLNRASVETIAEQIDFEKEQLLLFAWQGSGQDRMHGHTSSGKELTTTFTYSPGTTEDLKTHVMVFALPKDTKWDVNKNERIIFRCGVGEAPGIQLKIEGADGVPRLVQPRAEVK